MYKIKLNNGFKVVFISAIIYLFVNLFENIFYYSIGRHSDKKIIELEIPTKRDWIKIIIITIFFAFIQGILTWEFE